MYSIHGMETESVRSGFSDQSLKVKPQSRNHTIRSTSSHRSSHHHSSRNARGQKKPDNFNMPPYQTAATLEGNRDGQDVIEVEILHQDENWGENTTAVTGNTSEQSGSIEEMALWPGSESNQKTILCRKYFVNVLLQLLAIITFISPLAMIILPKIGVLPSITMNLNDHQKDLLLSCRAECKGLLVSFAIRMVLLAIGSWMIYLRPVRYTMPRIFVFRAVIVLLALITCVAYWLFFVVQITEGVRGILTSEDEFEYKMIVSYSNDFLNTLLFIHYISVVLMEIRHLRASFYVKVVRSPDGESRSYCIGMLSIQRAAVVILEKYYTEFPIYNPYLERLPVSRSKKSSTSFKFYDVDGFNGSNLQPSQSRTVLNGHSRRRDSSHNERFYEEHDYERRVKKRRARLITAAEDTFTHIRRTHETSGTTGTMDANEAAQAVFPSLARALQKYLRITRQQPRHSVDSILEHLATCLSNDLSPKVFLEPFLIPAPVLQNEKEQKPVQPWSLICNELLTRPIRTGTEFQLRQNDISLFCTVHALPVFMMTEEIIPPQANRFTLRLSSETSV